MKTSRKFIDRVLRESTVDTAKYRYRVKEFSDRQEVQRLPINQLDTTASIDSWETVSVIR